jgi:FMN phosphatase YigB (HAD superfamily)
LTDGRRDATPPPEWVAGLRAVTFDFGNTLVPVGRDDLRRAVELTVDAVLGLDGRAGRTAFLEAWAEERERQFAEEVPAFREVDISQRFVRVFARTRGMAAPPREERWDDRAAAAYSDAAEVAAAVDRYVDSFVRALPARPGIESLLAALAGRYALAVVSNWPVAAAIDRYLAAAGWLRHLTAVVVSERVGTIKPRAEIFRATEEAFAAAGVDGATDPARILHVGDDWAADIVGAKEAGWRAAYLRAPSSRSLTNVPCSTNALVFLSACFARSLFARMVSPIVPKLSLQQSRK